MPTYSSLDSPSLRKMEGYKRDSFGKRKRFSMGNIFGDPFALATISVGIVCSTQPETHGPGLTEDVDGLDNRVCQLCHCSRPDQRLS